MKRLSIFVHAFLLTACYFGIFESTIIIVEDAKACFRRVLAGKRIAPHWVRRTLACERVEDCMQECGHEKRFTCEGFNYRLDPSGHGQGDCELIEVPLAEMDLYSSAHNRDSNLLRHPDYDYYERDRNAPSSCRQVACNNCGWKPSSPSISYETTGTYRPTYDHTGTGYGSSDRDRYRPDTPVDRYRPTNYDRPTDYNNYYSSNSHRSSYGSFRPASYGSDIDRYDVVRPEDQYHQPRPGQWQVQSPSSSGTGYGAGDYDRDHFRPAYRPSTGYSPYRPDRFSSSSSGHEYSDRDRNYDKPTKFIPYQIGGRGNSWGSYGGSYGGGSSNSNTVDYWGIRHENRRHDSTDFNYFDLGDTRKVVTEHNTGDENNNVWNYPGSKYGGSHDRFDGGRPNYGNQWTRRPADDECSVKSSEGFRLHKGATRVSHMVPTITECEKLCSSEDKFTCHTYSYRYSTAGRDNCLLCDRPYNRLDYYTDLEPDRDYDIYSMADDQKICQHPIETTAITTRKNNAQCFFRAIDATRLFKSVVRDSLTVRSVGECELECIKSIKFTCRGFAYRYGQRTPGGVIDNCQLTDWPCRDLDKDRHLLHDPLFDIFERASYGHGCEIQPIVDDKHKKCNKCKG